MRNFMSSLLIGQDLPPNAIVTLKTVEHAEQNDESASMNTRTKKTHGSPNTQR